MTAIEEFMTWCRDQRHSLKQQIALMKDGTLRLRHNNEDVTERAIADCERTLREIDELIAKYGMGTRDT